MINKFENSSNELHYEYFTEQEIKLLKQIKK